MENFIFFCVVSVFRIGNICEKQSIDHKISKNNMYL